MDKKQKRRRRKGGEGAKNSTGNTQEERDEAKHEKELERWLADVDIRDGVTESTKSGANSRERLDNDAEHLNDVKSNDVEVRCSPSPPPEMVIVVEEEEITQRFLDACSKLVMGELARLESFHLMEAMSAIELMDPKMDSGMVIVEAPPTIEDAVADGWLEMDASDLLAMVDATLACLVTWLEGGMLTQTVLTNLLITDPDTLSAAAAAMVHGPSMSFEVMTALAHAFAHLVLLVRHTVQTASVFEEEDFNPHQPFIITSSFKREDVSALLSVAEKRVLATADKAEKIEREANASAPPLHALRLRAVASRLSWLRLLLSALCHVVLPRVDDSITPGGSPAAVAAAQAGMEKAAAFKPKLKAAVETLSMARECARRFAETSEMGTMAPSGQDGNYNWLRGFVPDLNRRFMPATFPRKTEMHSRRLALSYLDRLTCRLLEIAVRVPAIVTDVHLMLNYLRSFCEIESCVLSRSVLQLVLLPNDERVLGEVPLGEILTETIRSSVAPPFLFKDSPSARSSTCVGLWAEFQNDTVKVILQTIQVLGNNLARQWEKLTQIFEDLSTLQTESERLDSEVTHCTTSFANAHDGAYKGPPPGPSVSTWVLQFSLRLVQWHFEIGFRLNLFVPYEFTYVYWYMRDVLCKWMMNTVEKSSGMILTEHRLAMQSVVKKTEKTMPARAVKLEEKLKKRMNACRSLYMFGEERIFNAYFTLTLGLISDGKIKVPEWFPGLSETRRFEHRMAPYVVFGVPIWVNYDFYERVSGVRQFLEYGTPYCYESAAQLFEKSREILEQTPEARQLAIARVCKQNAVVCKILASGRRPEAKIVFDFSDLAFPLYPLLKFA